VTPFVLLALAFATLIVGGVTAAGAYDWIEARLARRTSGRPAAATLATGARAVPVDARRTATPSAARPTPRSTARPAAMHAAAARPRRAPRARRRTAAAPSVGSGAVQAPLFPMADVAPGRAGPDARSARSSVRQVAASSGPGRARIVVRRLGTHVAGGC